MAQIILDSSNNLIQGDFDNATVNNRTKFKTTTTNATTNVYAVPNGSATSAGFTATNAADPTNASKITIATNGSTDTQIISGVNGTGTYLPMSFYVNNTLALQISTAGVVSAPYGGFSGAGTALLGTLNTTSGTTQTLSGLTLTNYKLLQITFNNVGFTSGTNNTALRIAGIDLSSAYATTTTSTYGILTIDLSTGAASGTVMAGYINTNGTNTIVQTGTSVIAGNLSTISTSTTSIAFTFAAGNTFTNGTIKVYGA